MLVVGREDGKQDSTNQFEFPNPEKRKASINFNELL